MTPVQKKEEMLLVGSRYVNNQVNVVNWDIKRLLLSYFASKYVRFITRIPVFDTTAGFVCYGQKSIRNVFNLIKLNLSATLFKLK